MMNNESFGEQTENGMKKNLSEIHSTDHLSSKLMSTEIRQVAKRASHNTLVGRIQSNLKKKLVS
jgi:hypothetical protein